MLDVSEERDVMKLCKAGERNSKLWISCLYKFSLFANTYTSKPDFHAGLTYGGVTFVIWLFK